MEIFGTMLVGITAGWLMRSGVDSSRELAVRAIAAAHEASHRARRMVAVEREHLEDLLAEGRARFETERARRVQRSGGEVRRPVAVPHDRAA